MFDVFTTYYQLVCNTAYIILFMRHAFKTHFSNMMNDIGNLTTTLQTHTALHLALLMIGSQWGKVPFKHQEIWLWDNFYFPVPTGRLNRESPLLLGSFSDGQGIRTDDVF